MVELSRRSILHSVAAGVTGLAAGPVWEAITGTRRDTDRTLASATISSEQISDYEANVEQCLRDYVCQPAAQVLSKVALDLGEVRRYSAERQPPNLAEDLCHVTAELGMLGGMLITNLGDHTEARSWFRTARHAADQTGDSQLRAWVRVEEAVLPAYYGDPNDVVTLTGRAHSIAGHIPCTASVMARGLEARAWAKLGNASAARDAMRQAESLYDRLRPEQTRSDRYGFGARRWHFYLGSMHTDLRNTREAWAHQEQALALYPETEKLEPSIIRLQRAALLVSDNELDDACRLATTTILDLPEEHRSHIVMNQARGVLEAIPATRRSLPAAREFSDVLALSRIS